MTANQIQYAKYLEDSRHNRESENAAYQQAGASARQAEAALAGVGESRRHNTQSEMINWFSAQQQADYNAKMAAAREKDVSSLASSRSDQNAETARANQAREQETNRANVKSEQQRTIDQVISGVRVGTDVVSNLAQLILPIFRR